MNSKILYLYFRHWGQDRYDLSSTNSWASQETLEITLCRPAWSHSTWKTWSDRRCAPERGAPVFETFSPMSNWLESNRHCHRNHSDRSHGSKRRVYYPEWPPLWSTAPVGFPSWFHLGPFRSPDQTLRNLILLFSKKHSTCLFFYQFIYLFSAFIYMNSNYCLKASVSTFAT